MGIFAPTGDRGGRNLDPPLQAWAEAQVKALKSNRGKLAEEGEGRFFTWNGDGCCFRNFQIITSRQMQKKRDRTTTLEDYLELITVWKIKRRQRPALVLFRKDSAPPCIFAVKMKSLYALDLESIPCVPYLSNIAPFVRFLDSSLKVWVLGEIFSFNEILIDSENGCFAEIDCRVLWSSYVLRLLVYSFILVGRSLNWRNL